MKMDREALPSMDVVLDALYKTYREVHSENGWQVCLKKNIDTLL
jgi:hypothetical protein